MGLSLFGNDVHIFYIIVVRLGSGVDRLDSATVRLCIIFTIPKPRHLLV